MGERRLRRWQAVYAVVCSLAVGGLVVFAYQGGFFSRPDNFFYDLNFLKRGPQPVSGKVSLVLIDEKSASELGSRRGGWSRSQMALALTNLCAAGASVVGLDMLLLYPSHDPLEDRSLAEAMRTCGNVVLARVSSAAGAAELVSLAVFTEEMAGDGFIDLPLDQDDVLRKVRFLNARPAGGEGVELLPSFALELVRVYYNLSFALDFSGRDRFFLGGPGEGRLSLPYPELLINYRGNYRTFDHLSFADAVRGRFRPEQVKDRIMLIGSAMAGQKDFFSTPYTRFYRSGDLFKGKFASVEEGVLGDKDPGVTCHAQAVETIITQAFLVRPPIGLTRALIMTAALLGVFFYWPKRGGMLEIALLLLGMGLVLVASYWAFVRYALCLPAATILAVMPVQFMCGLVTQKVFFRRRNAMVTELFGKYVSPKVVKELLMSDLDDAMAGRRQTVTVLFADIRDFTTMSERLGPRETASLLNRYFGRILPAIVEHDGTIDKLAGDAVMAFFGAPINQPDHPRKGALAALDIVRRLEALNLETASSNVMLRIGIGVSTGEVTVGNMGSDAFMNYTIIGDPVNLASRIEALNKAYGTTILLSAETAGLIGDGFALREIGTVQVKGREKPVTIHELLGLAQTGGT